MGTLDGQIYYDDSKATTPHATLAALRGFDQVVLIAGGRNKGIDLGELAAGGPHVRAVVAIGEAACDVAQAFAGASRDDEMGPAMFDYIADWNVLIEEVVQRAIEASPLGNHPLASALPRSEIAMGISALFLGIELLGQLDPERADTDKMFTSIAAMAQLAESMLQAGLVPQVQPTS